MSLDFLGTLSNKPLPKLIGLWIHCKNSYEDHMGAVFFDEKNKHRTSQHLEFFQTWDSVKLQRHCIQKNWAYTYLFED